VRRANERNQIGAPRSELDAGDHSPLITHSFRYMMGPRVCRLPAGGGSLGANPSLKRRDSLLAAN
jgi:hypothetical protein